MSFINLPDAFIIDIGIYAFKVRKNTGLRQEQFIDAIGYVAHHNLAIRVVHINGAFLPPSIPPTVHFEPRSMLA